MAIGTFNELKAAIADHLNDAGLLPKAEEFIAIAEARHKREVRIREMIKRSTATVTGRFLALPSDYLEAITFRILTNPVTVLKEINLFEMNRVRQETTGKVAFFTVHEEIEFDVTPNTSVTGEIIYYANLSALGPATATNALLTRAPDVYLYAALLAAAPFLVEDQRVPLWESLYVAARDGLKNLDRRAGHIGPQFPRIVGATP